MPNAVSLIPSLDPIRSSILGPLEDSGTLREKVAKLHFWGANFQLQYLEE
jgi:hypothetical protein